MGVDPARDDRGLLEEFGWWRTDYLWVWALDALVVYLRAASERLGVPIGVAFERIAAPHDVRLSPSS